MIQSVFDLLPKNPYQNRPDLIDPFASNPYVMTRGLGTLGFDFSSLLEGGDSGYGDVSNFNTSGGDGLGFEPISTFAAITGFVSKAEEWLGIGEGRREANVIVPYQNEIHNNLITPVYVAMEGSPSYAQLQSMLDAVTRTERAWLNFLHNTEWDDGRAAQQAEDWGNLYFGEMRRMITERLNTAGIFSQAASYFQSDEVPGLLPVSIPGAGAGGSALNYSTLPVGPQSAGFGPSGGSWFPELGAMNTVMMVGLAVGALYLFTRKGR